MCSPTPLGDGERYNTVESKSSDVEIGGIADNQVRDDHWLGRKHYAQVAGNLESAEDRQLAFWITAHAELLATLPSFVEPQRAGCGTLLNP
jgi:hypothetical protein